MYMLSTLHLVIAIVPIALLLTLSFFVLLVLRKVEEKGLKVFGYVVVSFIWLATLVVFSGTVYKMGRSSMIVKCICRHQMGMQQREQKGNMSAMNMPSMAMTEKSAAAKDTKQTGMSKCGGNKGIIFKGEQK